MFPFPIVAHMTNFVIVSPQLPCQYQLPFQKCVCKDSQCCARPQPSHVTALFGIEEKCALNYFSNHDCLQLIQWHWYCDPLLLSSSPPLPSLNPSFFPFQELTEFSSKSWTQQETSHTKNPIWGSWGLWECILWLKSSLLAWLLKTCHG